MPRWELEDVLNWAVAQEMAKDGWELVGVNGSHYFMRREVGIVIESRVSPAIPSPTPEASIDLSAKDSNPTRG